MKAIKVTMKAKCLTMECDRNEFALALKTWRLRTGLTQTAAARRFGCSRFTIMRAEAGKSITWEMAYRLFNRLTHELETERDEIHNNN